MKFARDFKSLLASQDFPNHWVAQAIPYGQLKKCLKKVQQELRDIGLDPQTLGSLLDPEKTAPVALNYRFNPTSDSQSIRPKLTVCIYLHNGVMVDAALTPDTRLFFQKIAADLPPKSPPTEPLDLSLDAPDATAAFATNTSPLDTEWKPDAEDQFEIIEVPLTFDSEFFDILQQDVNRLDALQAKEQEAMSTEIIHLGEGISEVAKPSRFSKSDLARWRQIFELYLDAEVFFATAESNHGPRSSQLALKQLQWFQGEVEKRGLARSFKLKDSHQAFTRFVTLNASLLQNLKFQELNKLAVFKILKKFDKRTSLGISQTFPAVVQADRLLAGSIAQDVCAQMSKQLVSVVPQINDYLCPVCFAIAYRPVRLQCKHVFCIRCIIRIQRAQEKFCPLCRADVVLQASADHLDFQLEKYMKKYFAAEVKEKERSNDLERGIEDFGPDYKPHECIIM